MSGSSLYAWVALTVFVYLFWGEAGVGFWEAAIAGVVGPGELAAAIGANHTVVTEVSP